MGWFTRKRTEPLPPDQLRDALFEAVHANDAKRLRALVDAQREAIREHFPSWKKVPEAFRGDPQKMNHYATGLIGVARFCAENGDPSLMALLTGPAADNPLTRWERALREAQELLARNRPAQAEAGLREILASTEGLTGSGADRYRPITIGLLGQCRFHQGDAGEAVTHFEKALAICRQAGDLEGEIAYVNSLHEAHRWLGHDREAIALAGEMALLFERAGNQERSRWASRRAARMSAGEPLVRTVAVIDGEAFELDELPPKPSGRVGFVFERNRISLGGVAALVEEGRRLGEAGEHQRALAEFQVAARLDPSDPEPPYLAGLALLELGRYDEAVQSYDTTERLAPGWYHCRADRWLAGELAAGRLSPETYRTVRSLGDGPGTAEDKARLAAVALALTPDLPVLYLLRAEALIRIGSAATAAVVARSGLERDPDPDVRTRLLVTLAQATGPEERRSLLQQAIALDGNRTAAAMARLMLRHEE